MSYGEPNKAIWRDKKGRESTTVKCPYCWNRFLGNSNAETEQLLERHIKNKHG